MEGTLFDLDLFLSNFIFLENKEFLALLGQVATIHGRPARILVSKPVPAGLYLFSVKGHIL